MSKNLTQSFSFDITSDEQFYTLAGAFGCAIRAVEEQGYAVDYKGKTLSHPGQIGVTGQAGIGKSAFFDAAMSKYLPADTQTSEQMQPSYDQTRLVQVWKRWLLNGSQKEYRIEDVHAEAALAHMPHMHPPDRGWAGVSIYEHVDERVDFCDMMMAFRYRDDGSRIVEIRTTDDVALSEEFSSGFLPQVRDITL